MTQDDYNKYPIPDKVGEYGTFEEFYEKRIEQAQWVHWEDRVELILSGDYYSVKPLHVELSPTYICNFACPWCSCKLARQDWLGEGMDVFNHPLANEKTIMCKEKLFHIISELSNSKTGIQWVGGEPTLNPFTFDGIKYANELALTQCLFTNGSIMPPDRIEEMLKSNLAFIRVSLDCIDQSTHTAFHGINPKKNYSERVLKNIEALAIAKYNLNSSVKIGFSIVVDEVNFPDLSNTLLFIRDLAKNFDRKDIINFIIVRPVYKYQGVESNVTNDTNTKLLEYLTSNKNLLDSFADLKIDLVYPTASFTNSTIEAADKTDIGCLSCSWFSAIKSSGEMELCSDVYGNPEYNVGNIGEEKLSDIWNGEKRKNVIHSVKEKKCFTNKCPKNGRGYYLNKIFYQIETKRKEGKINDVKHWIKDLQKITPKPEHSFFL